MGKGSNAELQEAIESEQPPSPWCDRADLLVQGGAINCPFPMRLGRSVLLSTLDLRTFRLDVSLRFAVEMCMQVSRWRGLSGFAGQLGPLEDRHFESSSRSSPFLFYGVTGRTSCSLIKEPTRERWAIQYGRNWSRGRAFIAPKPEKMVIRLGKVQCCLSVPAGPPTVRLLERRIEHILLARPLRHPRATTVWRGFEGVPPLAA